MLFDYGLDAVLMLRLFVLLAIVVVLSSAVTVEYPVDCTRIDTHGRTLCSLGEYFLNGQLTDSDLTSVKVRFPTPASAPFERTLSTVMASSPLDRSSRLFDISDCRISAINDAESMVTIYYACANTLNESQPLTFNFYAFFQPLVEYDSAGKPIENEYDSKPLTYTGFRIGWPAYFYGLADASLYNHTVDSFCADVATSCPGAYLSSTTCASALATKMNVQWDGIVRPNVDTQFCRFRQFYMNRATDLVAACNFNAVCVGAPL